MLAESAIRTERELTSAVAGSLYGRLATATAHIGVPQRPSGLRIVLLSCSGDQSPRTNRRGSTGSPRPMRWALPASRCWCWAGRARLTSGEQGSGPSGMTARRHALTVQIGAAVGQPPVKPWRRPRRRSRGVHSTRPAAPKPRRTGGHRSRRSCRSATSAARSRRPVPTTTGGRRRPATRRPTGSLCGKRP
jgi:hypothetical protein